MANAPRRIQYMRHDADHGLTAPTQTDSHSSSLRASSRDRRPPWMQQQPLDASSSSHHHGVGVPGAHMAERVEQRRQRETRTTVTSSSLTNSSSRSSSRHQHHHAPPSTSAHLGGSGSRSGNNGASLPPPAPSARGSTPLTRRSTSPTASRSVDGGRTHHHSVTVPTSLATSYIRSHTNGGSAPSSSSPQDDDTTTQLQQWAADYARQMVEKHTRELRAALQQSYTRVDQLQNKCNALTSQRQQREGGGVNGGASLGKSFFDVCQMNAVECRITTYHHTTRQRRSTTTTSEDVRVGTVTVCFSASSLTLQLEDDGEGEATRVINAAEDIQRIHYLDGAEVAMRASAMSHRGGTSMIGAPLSGDDGGSIEIELYSRDVESPSRRDATEQVEVRLAFQGSCEEATRELFHCMVALIESAKRRRPTGGDAVRVANQSRSGSTGMFGTPTPKVAKVVDHFARHAAPPSTNDVVGVRSPTRSYRNVTGGDMVASPRSEMNEDDERMLLDTIDKLAHTRQQQQQHHSSSHTYDDAHHSEVVAHTTRHRPTSDDHHRNQPPRPLPSAEVSAANHVDPTNTGRTHQEEEYIQTAWERVFGSGEQQRTSTSLITGGGSYRATRPYQSGGKGELSASDAAFVLGLSSHRGGSSYPQQSTSGNHATTRRPQSDEATAVDGSAGLSNTMTLTSPRSIPTSTRSDSAFDPPHHALPPRPIPTPYVTPQRSGTSGNEMAARDFASPAADEAPVSRPLPPTPHHDALPSPPQSAAPPAPKGVPPPPPAKKAPPPPPPPKKKAPLLPPPPPKKAPSPPPG